MVKKKKLKKLSGVWVDYGGCVSTGCAMPNEHVLELSGHWIIEWAEKAEKLGYDPTSCEIDTPYEVIRLIKDRNDGRYVIDQIENKRAKLKSRSTYIEERITKLEKLVDAFMDTLHSFLVDQGY